MFAERFEGTPLKHVALTSAAPDARVRGDAMVTRDGLEGGPVYALGAAIREALDADGRGVLDVDLRPDVTVQQLADRLRSAAARRTRARPGCAARSASTPSRSRSCGRRAGGALPSGADEAAALVKAVPVEVTGTMPIDRAISTAGGIAWSEVDDALMLRRRARHVRRRRDARLGGADGRLPAAGVVQHRGRRGPRGAGLASED